MQDAKVRHFILAGEVCCEAQRIVKNCEEKKTPLRGGSGVLSTRRIVLLLRVRWRLDRGQLLARCNVRYVRHVRDLTAGGIVDADTVVIEQ